MFSLKNKTGNVYPVSFLGIVTFCLYVFFSLRVEKYSAEKLFMLPLVVLTTFTISGYRLFFPAAKTFCDGIEMLIKILKIQSKVPVEIIQDSYYFILLGLDGMLNFFIPGLLMIVLIINIAKAKPTEQKV